MNQSDLPAIRQLAKNDAFSATNHAYSQMLDRGITYDDVKNLTIQNVKHAYQEMIDENIIDIIICGDFDEKEAVSYIKQYLPFNDRIKNYPSFYNVKNNETEKKSNLPFPTSCLRQ